MRLTCPVCHTKLKLAAEKLPPQGAWARCPKCGHPFFIPPATVASPVSELPPVREYKPAPFKAGQRDLESQKLLERLKERQGLPPRPEPPDPSDNDAWVRIVEARRFPSKAGLWGASFILVLSIFFLGYVFCGGNQDKIRNTTAVSQEETIWPGMAQEDVIRRDLIYIRKSISIYRQKNIEIEASGPESRVFKYFMAQLAPGVCSGISALTIEVNEHDIGFKAIGQCLESPSTYLVMHLDWGQNLALISFEGQPGRTEFSLR